MKSPSTSTLITRRQSLRLAVVGVLSLTTLSGCNETTQAAILGRWFSGDMSLRLRKDGTVVWNTRQGLAQGRYSFVGDVPRWKSENTTVRLRLDVTRNGRSIQPMLDLQFVGTDRIRVAAVSQTTVRATDRALTVLRRATQKESSTDTLAESKRGKMGVRRL